jgi:acetoin utilization deacetylase AcuC-like enzyme
MPTGFLYDKRFLDHDTGAGHPERPDRLRAIVAALAADGLMERMTTITAIPVDLEHIDAVHTLAHRERIERLCAAGGGMIDADTVICRESNEIALLAAGGVIAACDAVMSGDCANAFCAVRPPGHHAESGRPMGFCLYNNVAVAARYLQRRHGVGRVLIVDWDVHHGNGTQEIFESDPSVFYASLHQSPLYPGTGARSERGIGEGIGTTLNIPLPAGSGDDEYAAAFVELLAAARAFRPEFVLISAGYDAHLRDPLAGMRVSREGFRDMTGEMVALAAEECDGRIVAVLEGGYDTSALAESVAATVEELLLGSESGR